jgi:hypothetical protein
MTEPETSAKPFALPWSKRLHGKSCPSIRRIRFGTHIPPCGKGECSPDWIPQPRNKSTLACFSSLNAGRDFAKLFSNQRRIDVQEAPMQDNEGKIANETCI